MLKLFVILWVLIELKAPVWCYFFIGLAATAKIVVTTIKLIK